MLSTPPAMCWRPVPRESGECADTVSVRHDRHDRTAALLARLVRRTALGSRIPVAAQPAPAAVPAQLARALSRSRAAARRSAQRAGGYDDLAARGVGRRNARGAAA